MPVCHQSMLWSSVIRTGGLHWLRMGPRIDAIQTVEDSLSSSELVASVNFRIGVSSTLASADFWLQRISVHETPHEQHSDNTSRGMHRMGLVQWKAGEQRGACGKREAMMSVGFAFAVLRCAG